MGCFFCALIVRWCSRVRVQKWGAQRDMPENPILAVFRGGSAAQQLSQQVRKISAVALGHHAAMLKMRLSNKKRFFVFCLWHRFVGSIGFEARMINWRAKCAEPRGKWGFYISDLEIATRSKKWGSWKKGPKFISWARSANFCVFFWRASIFSKTGFSKSTDFAWNHCNRSAIVARPKTTIFAPKGPKSAILELTARGSRNISHCIALPFPFTFKKTRRIPRIFLPFPFLTTGPFL